MKNVLHVHSDAISVILMRLALNLNKRHLSDA